MEYQSTSSGGTVPPKAAPKDARDWSHIRSPGSGAPSTEYFPFYGIDFEVGSTDAFETAGKKIPDTRRPSTSASMTARPESHLLVEQHTYATVFETGLPLGYKFTQVRMDKDGLLPDDLDLILSTWDESARGGKKPRLLYTIPTGQNPTGTTQPLPRRQAIYRVAQKHDLFIVKDDPYYFAPPQSPPALLPQ
ncbi:hypothetical protein VN97_g7894 [Penicillium thymicola]|uniref:Aminotransferase class I/classII domain-containing protein n=1 Tax=Penicillium thymicola TaxID=293382 RepID=A0AAI9TER2_PENTH|nr:hypothetical protein VN97_g7894 [Penicillium thymicola]